MSYAYTAPQVILDLIAALKAALPGTDVLDGPVVSGTSIPEAVTVGFVEDEEGLAAIEAETDREQYTLDPARERYSINCQIAVVAATSQIAVARARCFELLRAVNGVLVAEDTFTATVLSAQVGRYSLYQFPALARLAFGVDVDAFTKEG